MKNFILCIFTMLSIQSFAQLDTSICHDYLVKHHDQMTNKNTIVSNTITLAGDSTQANGEEIKIYFQKSTSDVIMVIKISGEKSCIETSSTLYFLFTDGSRMHFNSNTQFNCKGEALVYFGVMFGNDLQFKSLKNKKLKAIRVSTSGGYVEKNLSSEEAESFIHSLNCISKYSYRWKGY